MSSNKLNIALFAVLFVLANIGSLYWFESQKELYIVCDMLPEGTDISEVNRLLGTTELSSIETDGNRYIDVSSIYSMKTATCMINLDEAGLVSSSVFEKTFSLSVTTTYIIIAFSGLMIIFQFMLVLGYPLGEYAWGGKQKKLSGTYRIGSVLAIFVYLFYLIFVLEVSRVYPLLNDPGTANIGLIIMMVVFSISTIANLFSASEKERVVMTPIAALFSLCTVVIIYSNSALALVGQ